MLKCSTLLQAYNYANKRTHYTHNDKASRAVTMVHSTKINIKLRGRKEGQRKRRRETGTERERERERGVGGGGLRRKVSRHSHT